MSSWQRFAEAFLDWDVIVQYLPAIGSGLIVTVEIAALVVICGIVLGLVLVVLRSYRITVVN